MSTNHSKTFHILSIDGGGILGLYSANILSRIEKEYCNGKPLSDYFHLLTGTSTGGIIALALSTGCKAEEIESFYKNFAKDIFPSNRKNRVGILNNKYSNKELKKALSIFFGNKSISDCKTHVCIPSIDVSTCHPIVFKTNNNGTQTRDEKYSLVDIALATSAAPTFFPIHSFDTYQGLIDGGLWQNNPSMIGLIEALSNFVGENKEFSDISILSIGNPNSSIKESVDTKTNKSGLLKWKTNIVTLPMKINSIATDSILSILSRSKAAYISKYLRIDCGVLSDSFKDLKLDSSDDDSIKNLLELGAKDFYNKKYEITNFFSEEN